MSLAIAPYLTGGQFDPSRMANAVGTSAQDVAFTAGLGRDAVQRRDRVNSPKTQRRLRELAELMVRVKPGLGSEMLAYAWIRSQPLPGFGDMTAMQLIREGHADWVHEYLDAVEAGIHA